MAASSCFPNGSSAPNTPRIPAVGLLLAAALLVLTGCADEPTPTDASAIDSEGVSPNASERPVDAAAARFTGFRLREQVGRLDLIETGGSEEAMVPPDDLNGSVAANAEELHRASLHAQRRAAELGLVASMMLADADGILYADFVDPAVAYSDSRGSGSATASDRPLEDDDFGEKGWSHGVDNR